MASNSFNADIANTVSVSQKLNRMISSSSRDYNAWRLLISEIETSSPEDRDTVCLAYDSFLSTFPLCHWHMEKYAHHKAKLCGSEEAIEIYERGVQVAMYSVGFWADYFTFVTACFKDPKDVRRLFGRAISFVGRDYFGHVLWDKYIKYEFSQEGWSFLAVSYVQALRFPTKKLQFYFNNFKQFVTNLGEEMGSEMTTSCELKNVSVSCTTTETSKDDILAVVKDMLESSDKSLKCKALHKYRAIGEELYREACRLGKEIKCFETKIRRRYFYATSVDDDELNNWHHYLDFVENQGNLDLAVSVYERCLIPCANYPEFWSRFVEFLESKGGRELALSALHRATQIFLKNIPEIHVLNARYKERIGDIDGARAALLLHVTETDNGFIENVVTLANLERHLGNYDAASATYKDAIEAATEKQKLHVLPMLYSHFARLTFLITGSVDATRNVLLDGLHVVPRCKFLLEELIKFVMTHDGSNQVNIVNSVIYDSISPTLDEDEGLSARDREDISCLFLEFVNLCGTVEDVMKAWNHHVKLFPQFLRMSSSNKSFVSTKVLSDAAGDRERSYHVTVTDQPSNSTLLLRQEVQVQGNLPTQDIDNSKAKETVPTLLQDNESTPRLSIQSREGVVSKSSDQCEAHALIRHHFDQVLSSHPREDEPRPMEFGAQLSDQSQRSSQRIDKSSKPPDADGEALSDSLDVQPELKKQKLQISLDHVPSRFQENRAHELTSMPETKSNLPAPNGNILHDESRRDESVSNLGNSTNMPDQKVPPTTYEVPVAKDDGVPTPGNSSSQLHTHTKDQKQLAGYGLNDKTITSSQEQPPSATPTSTMRPPPSASPQVSSYPQQSSKEDASQQNQHQRQAHQNPAMNQMLQYQYNHEQLMQQYQQQQQIYMNQQPYEQGQQIYMQYPYNQYYVNQQPYQIQSQQQQQQQHMNPYNFQGHHPYQVQQLMSSCQQGQGPQAQALAYQGYQPGYQNTQLGQQYANYQDMNNHTQPHQESVPVQNQHVGPGQKQSDEQTEGPKLSQ